MAIHNVTVEFPARKQNNQIKLLKKIEYVNTVFYIFSIVGARPETELLNRISIL